MIGKILAVFERIGIARANAELARLGYTEEVLRRIRDNQ